MPVRRPRSDVLMRRFMRGEPTEFLASSLAFEWPRMPFDERCAYVQSALRREMLKNEGRRSKPLTRRGRRM